MNKKYHIVIFSFIALTTSVLIVLGFMFKKTEEEKINWLAEAYDVSHEGDLIFVKYNKGTPEIYRKQQGRVEFIFSLANDTEVLDIAYTPDGKEIVYATTRRDSDDLSTDVTRLNIETMEMEELFKVEALITELQFDPKDAQKLYYLMARTFENYSPIVREYPHNFDLFHVDLRTMEHIAHSDFKKYSMRSLQVSAEKEAVYVQMDDDFLVETADELFESKQRIFELILDSKEGFTVATDPERDVDLFDFALVPGEDALVYQSIANYDAGGTFEYELFYYDRKTKEETQLTNFSSYVGRPVISPNEEKIYFIVNDNFGKSNVPNRSIYTIDMSGDNVTRVNLTNE